MYLPAFFFNRKPVPRPPPGGSLLGLIGRLGERPADRSAGAATEIGQRLDAMDHAGRVLAIGELGKAEQRRLWHALEGVGGLRLTDLVPASVPDGATVCHIGKNTLPAFTRFEKRFSRPPGEDPAAPAELWGYNHQESAVGSWFAGPGYFVTVADQERGELLIDYRRLPPERPAGWPPIRSNERGGGRLVYGFMVDRLRRVSADVTIGRARRHGKELDAWFVLCREPPGN